MYYIAKGTLFNTPGITYLGKESQKKKDMCICVTITESLCSTSDTI